MNNFKFLPHYIGYASLGLAILSGIVALALFFISGDISPLLEKTLRTVTLLGLAFAVISREKHEDERMLSLRWKASSVALTMGAIFALNNEWLADGPEEQTEVFPIVLMMLIMYHVALQIAKRS